MEPEDYKDELHLLQDDVKLYSDMIEKMKEKLITIETLDVPIKLPGAQDAPWSWGDEKDKKYGATIGELRVGRDGKMTFLSANNEAIKVESIEDLKKIQTIALLKK